MLRVCVVFGGASSEHEVSLRSASCVLENLDKTRYDILMLGITKSGQWLHYTGPIDLIATGQWEFSSYLQPALFSMDKTRPGLLLLDDGSTAPAKPRRSVVGGDVERYCNVERLEVDVVFPVLHGKNGEDGTMQGLLDLAGLKYVGCGTLSSAMCMDKEISHIVLQGAGVPKTKLIAIHMDEMSMFKEKAALCERELEYPMFVKPANAGSSVGVSKVKNRAELEAGLKAAFEHDRKAVVERQLIGREVECAVLGNRNAIAAELLGEIAPTHEFYDYAGKYLDDSTGLHIPARIDEAATQRVRELALKAYHALECRGLARVDFFVGDDGLPVLNEINTLPGFTPISMYQRLFESQGLTCSELCNKLIDCALKD